MPPMVTSVFPCLHNKHTEFGDVFKPQRKPRQSNNVRKTELCGMETLLSIPECLMVLTYFWAPLFGEGRDHPWTQIHSQLWLLYLWHCNLWCIRGLGLKAAVRGALTEVSLSYREAAGSGCWVLGSLHHSLTLFTFQKLVVLKHSLIPWSTMGTIWKCQQPYGKNDHIYSCYKSSSKSETQCHMNNYFLLST